MVELAGGRTVRLFFICLSHYPPSGAQDFRIISQANSQVQYGDFFFSLLTVILEGFALIKF